jgi:hypothetical protein
MAIKVLEFAAEKFCRAQALIVTGYRVMKN